MVRPRKGQKVTEGLAQRKLPKYSVISNGKARSATAERSQETDAVITPKTQTRHFPLRSTSQLARVSGKLLESGAPGEIRTPDLLLRRQSLYPTELRAHSDTSSLHVRIAPFNVCAGGHGTLL